MKKLAYGTYGSLFGIGHLKQKIDKNPEVKGAAKEAAKETISDGKRLLKKLPKAIIHATQKSKEWA